MLPTVWPDFFEVGGVYDHATDDNGGQLGGLTQAEIEREFGGYDASLANKFDKKGEFGARSLKSFCTPATLRLRRGFPAAVQKMTLAHVPQI
jgi:hypothetical protein